MRSLVTGGAGFIGSHVVDGLLAAGHEVTVLDDLSTGRVANLSEALARGAELAEGDVRDADAMNELVARVAPTTIFHLAAQIDVRRSVGDPAFDARLNIEGTLNLLAAARSAGVARFVNSSSGGALYGEVQTARAAEDHPIAPEAPYGQSKYAAEGYCDLFARLHGLSTVSLRYGNVYGPRQDPLGEAGVIAIFCDRVETEAQPTIFGDGRQTRDYVYVADVVSANLAAAAADATGPFNVGSGVETSVLDLIDGLRELGGHGLEPEHAAERLGEVRRSVLDAAQAREQLGWEPRVDVREGLRRTLDAQRQAPVQSTAKSAGTGTF